MKQFLLLLFMLCLFSGTKLFSGNIAEKGVFYLTKEELSKGIVELNGEWEIYYNKLLTPNDFKENVFGKEYISYPKYIDFDSENKHYATYRLIVKSDIDTILKLKMGEILTSYKIWFNNTLLHKNGRVGVSEDKSIPSSYPFNGTVHFKKGENEIIIQFSNYFHRISGSFKSIEIGSVENIDKKIIIAYLFDIFLFGALFIMAIYHLFLFFLRRKEIASLAFGVYLLLISYRTISTGGKLLFYLFPDYSWRLNLKIEYLSFYLGVPLVVLFFHLVYKKHVKSNVPYIVYAIGIIFSLFVLFTSAKLYAYTVEVYQVFTLLCIVYVSSFLIKLLRLKEKGVVPILIGSIVFFLTIVSDILYALNIYVFIELASLGLFVFTLSQSYLLAQNFTFAFDRNEQLTKKLNYQNKNLETIVQERTEEILQQKEEILAQKDELEKQHDQLTETNSELSVKNKQITDSINYAQRIQSALLPPENKLKELFADVFVIFKPKDIVSGDFYWIAETPELIYIAAADCTGHGVPGAFMSMIGNTLLNEIISKGIIEPSEILDELNIAVLNTLKQGSSKQDDGMDVSLCCIDSENRKLKIACAVQTPFFFKGEELISVKGDFYSIGEPRILKKKLKFKQFESDYKPGDLLYLFSDGMPDQFGGANNTKYSKKQLLGKIKDVKKESFEKQKQIIEESFVEWINKGAGHSESGKNPQIDDVLLMGIKF